MSSINRAIRVARGEESGQRCGLAHFAALVFIVAPAVLAILALALVLGGGQ